MTTPEKLVTDYDTFIWVITISSLITNILLIYFYTQLSGLIQSLEWVIWNITNDIISTLNNQRSFFEQALADKEPLYLVYPGYARTTTGAVQYYSFKMLVELYGVDERFCLDNNNTGDEKALIGFRAKDMRSLIKLIPDSSGNGSCQLITKKYISRYY